LDLQLKTQKIQNLIESISNACIVYQLKRE